MKHTRRDVLKVGLGALPMICIGSTMPAFVPRMAAAGPTASAGLSNDNILVIVQLSGGNDGLNTVVPVGQDPYMKARQGIALTKDLHRLDDRYSLNSGMKAFKQLFDDGKLAVINGCGYPKPNRSHFESMAIWHSADPKNPGQGAGWLGHYLDHLSRGTNANALAAVNVGSQLPQALVNTDAPAPSVNSFEDFTVRLLGRDNGNTEAERKIITHLNEVSDKSSTLAFLTRQATNAIVSADEMRKVAGNYKADAEYPRGLGDRLKLIAQIINGNFGTRVFYCEQGGYDTHANQVPSHERLLKEMSDSIAAFQKDMEAKGYGDKVTVMCFSEFGRRLAQNNSGGTDHGAAGPMFVVGNKVKGGLHGEYSGLEKSQLDDGDLKYTTDFRRVYATLLDGWLNTKSVDVLNAKYEPLPIL